MQEFNQKQEQAMKEFIQSLTPNQRKLAHTLFDLKENISPLTNSETGSAHWFNTLVSEHARVGEYIKDGGSPGEEILKQWGQRLYETSNHLLENLPLINR